MAENSFSKSSLFSSEITGELFGITKLKEFEESFFVRLKHARNSKIKK